MSFDQSTLTEVRTFRDGADLLVSWTSTAPSNTFFHVYVSRRFSWSGTSRHAVLPWPGAHARIDVGAVLAAEADIDLSASLPAGPSDRPRLDWLGGTFLADDIETFRVYRGNSSGGAVSYAAPVATIAAYPQGIIHDGFGLGGFGLGGFGRAPSEYSWTGPPLSAGTWNFAVRAADEAGNEGSGATASLAIEAPPRPPAANASGVRLTYTYNPATRVATLAWLASPV